MGIIFWTSNVCEKGGVIILPVIGITADRAKKDGTHMVKNTYVQAVIRAGGMPFIVPSGVEGTIEEVVHRLDGVILTGGGDIDPTLFGAEPHPHLGEVEPERDQFEIALTNAMIQAEKPILGICRGMQVLNIAFGGNMYQDIYAERKNLCIQHGQKAPTYHPSHYVQLEKGSLLQKIAQLDRIKVNSFHHQAVKDVLRPLTVCGIASDGIIEAIESTSHPFLLGVQWHPEALVQKEDDVSIKIFEAFVRKSMESRD